MIRQSVLFFFKKFLSNWNLLELAEAKQRIGKKDLQNKKGNDYSLATIDWRNQSNFILRMANELIILIVQIYGKDRILNQGSYEREFLDERFPYLRNGRRFRKGQFIMIGLK